MTKNSSLGAEWASRFATLMGDQTDAVPTVQDDPVELLTPEEMGEADRRAIASGIRGSVLMERAGEAVAAAAGRMVAAGSRIAVLAGSGNNGGDGFVAARLLQAAGYRVSVFLARRAKRAQGRRKPHGAAMDRPGRDAAAGFRLVAPT